MAGMSWIRALTLASVALVGCSKPKPSDQDAQIRDTASQIEAWEKANGAKVSPTVLRLRDGSCLDASRLPSPWLAMQDDGPLRLIIAAPQGEVGVEPARPLGDDGRPKATPAALLIWIKGWSRPPSEGFGWRGPTPQTVEENIRIGVFKPIAIWPANALRFQAFVGPGGENHYTDDRRFSQCRGLWLGLRSGPVHNRVSRWAVQFRWRPSSIECPGPSRAPSKDRRRDRGDTRQVLGLRRSPPAIPKPAPTRHGHGTRPKTQNAPAGPGRNVPCKDAPAEPAEAY
jgi:hypothetical protein